MKVTILTIISAILISACSLSAQQIDTQKKLEYQLRLRARNLEQMGRYDLALDAYRDLWENYPTNINYYRGVYNNLLRLGRLEEAEDVVHKMLQQTKSDLVRADLGEVYYKQGKKEQALETWNDILESRPRSQSTYQIVALTMQRNSLFDEAIEVYRLGQKNLKNDKLFLVDMANLYRNRRDFVNAVQQYVKYLNAFPNQYNFVESNVISMVSNDDYSHQILEILQEYVRNNDKNMQLKRLLAAAYFRRGEYEQALRAYQEIDHQIFSQKKRSNERLGSEIYQFAQNAYNDGEYEFAMQGYQLLLQRYPNSAYATSAKIAIGKCMRLLGKYSEAIEYLQNLVSNTKNRNVRKNALFQSGEIYLYNLHDYVAAERSYREVLAIPLRSGIDKLALFRIGECYIKRKDLDKAKAWFSDLLSQGNLSAADHTRAKFIIGKINFWLGDFDAAKNIFQSIIDEPLLVADRNEGIYVNDAIEYSMLINNAKDKERLKKYAQAKLSQESGELERAEKFLNDLLKEKQIDELKDRILVDLGDIHFRMGKYASAISDFRRLIEEMPGSVFADYAQKRIGDAYREGLKDTNAAVKAYELVLENYPDSIYLDEVRKKIRSLEQKKSN